eukprot:CAMPEP_0119343782 /NCGR_PEP_ID=MMETSP1333-20130426/106631_1 /TAXON_ID=418940 /ORGANISM="Scyphosphaera apsteinii, Strain RCC1455" /LENGTH=145 /DNA_ID=CAMNT_0007356195 /DNA_START=237 /DNA_END=674 /DNA_ORIENTATION=+
MAKNIAIMQQVADEGFHGDALAVIAETFPLTTTCAQSFVTTTSAQGTDGSKRAADHSQPDMDSSMEPTRKKKKALEACATSAASTTQQDPNGGMEPRRKKKKAQEGSATSAASTTGQDPNGGMEPRRKKKKAQEGSATSTASTTP